MRRTYVAILISLVFLVVAGGAWWYLQAHAASGETVMLPVPAKDIEPYTVIRPEDLTTRQFVNPDEVAVRSKSDIVGKVATTRLTKGWPIDQRVLRDPIGDYQVVGVNIDVARYGGVKAGDLVDVYWLTPDVWDPARSARLVTQNARVVQVADERGQPLDEQTGIVQGSIGGVSRGPAVVYLLVSPKDVDRIVGGSAPKNVSIALAKKGSPTETVQEVEADDSETEE